jgi:hypothetical protein
MVMLGDTSTVLSNGMGFRSLCVAKISRDC